MDSNYDNLEIIHDFKDEYFVLLTRPENEGFCVYQPKNQAFQKIRDCSQSFIGFHVQDVQGRQVLHMQYSPTRSEIIDLCGSQEIAVAKEPLKDQVSKVLTVQRKKAKKAVEDLANEVKDLEHTLVIAISDLTLNNVDFSVAENDLLRGLFDGHTLKSHSKNKVTLEISDVKVSDHTKEKIVWIQVTNTSEFVVKDLQFVLLSSGQVQIVEQDLETMIKARDRNRVFGKIFRASSRMNDHQDLPVLISGERH